jgi:hypothetical protein
MPVWIEARNEEDDEGTAILYKDSGAEELDDEADDEDADEPIDGDEDEESDEESE